MSAYEYWLRPWLFRLDAEEAHERVVGALALAGRAAPLRALLRARFAFSDPMLETTVAGLRFPNPVGLAAGFDKDCRLLAALPCLGFGFVEAGTVTLRPQPGNPRPRMFRFPEAGAIVNRLGFNSAGAEAAAARLAALGARPVPIGLNIGVNADVAAEDAPAEYARVFAKLEPYGDYFTVNVSSPNTAGLRRLQEKLRLERILESIRERDPKGKPIFVKLSPDLAPEQLADAVAAARSGASGLVCTNTTVSRDGAPPAAASTSGGLSGAPLRDLSTRMIREVYRMTEGRLPIIGVGGIMDPHDAYQKIRAGASLVQVYTGLVYRGPGLIRRINEGICALLRTHGLKSVSEAVGASHARAGTGA